MGGRVYAAVTAVLLPDVFSQSMRIGSITDAQCTAWNEFAGWDDQDKDYGGDRYEQVHACTGPCQQQIRHAQRLAQKTSGRLR